MKKAYLVKYCGGSHDDTYELDIFVTHNKKTAENYVFKFNEMLKKWVEYYKQFEEDSGWNFNTLKEEFIEQHYDRWSMLNRITYCYYEEIEIR